MSDGGVDLSISDLKKWLYDGVIEGRLFYKRLNFGGMCFCLVCLVVYGDIECFWWFFCYVVLCC